MRITPQHMIMASLPQRTTAETATIIPDRLYFKIGDVARICALEPYVLRFWESQFPQLKVNKSGTGQRLYRRRDVELVLEIKSLVHGQGFTLAGARQALEHANHRPTTQKTLPLARAAARRSDSAALALERVRAELREIAGLLAAPAVRPPQRRRTRFATVASGELFSS